MQSSITFHKDKAAASLLYDDTSNSEIVEEIKAEFLTIKSDKNSSQSIGIIVNRGVGLGVQTFEYSLPELSLIPYLHPDTQAFHESIVNQLGTKDWSGLYLMYGQPGTGKTSFIKDILQKNIQAGSFYISLLYGKFDISQSLFLCLWNIPILS
ncbi:MAG: hypothetical protein U5K69_12015 [Balneolaceae bacterium]|nr:hypothetical protein [Balneolaceae bacterium]